MATTHILPNGFTATRNGKGFDVYKNGVFHFTACRLKIAKSYAQQQPK